MTRRGRQEQIRPCQEMLTNAVYQKQLSFRTVLMDSWYAEPSLMRHIEALRKTTIVRSRAIGEVDD